MGSDDPGGDDVRGQISPEDRAAFKKRSKELEERLEGYRRSQEPAARGNGSAGGAMGQALKLAIDPVVGVVVGLFVGLMIDNAAGTKPLALIICLLLGAVAGMWNMVRSAGLIKPGRAAKREPDDDTSDGH